jgi:hypothetical protein
MSREQQSESFSVWLDTYMKKGGADVPARLVVVMALLERLHEIPTLNIGDHVAESGMQLKEHNKYVARALKHHEIISPVLEFGRRSSNLHGWIDPLFVWLKSNGFVSASGLEQKEMLAGAQSIAAGRLQIINQDKPLIARYNKGTAKAVIADILDQAQEKKRAKDVAEYLVGAKLQLRFGQDAATPKNVNTPNRDEPSDFRVGDAAIETTVNPVDARHLTQITQILKNTTMDVWLLVRLQDCGNWQHAVDEQFPQELGGRVFVSAIEKFVGQNVSEIGRFDKTKVAETLAELFRIYNERWLPETARSGLRIVSGDPDPK